VKRPILWALMFLIAGILFGWYQEVVDTIQFVLFMGVCVSACVTLYKWLRYAPIFLCVLAAAAGVLGIQQSLRDDVVSQQDVRLYGIIHDLRYTQAGWQRLVVAEEGSGYYVLAYLNPEFRVEIGQMVILTGDLHPLARAQNPGGYDEFLVQRARGIRAKFYARDVETFEVHMNLARITHLVRNRLAEIYDTVLPHREASLIKSITLGDQAGLDAPVREMYAVAGVYHLLVVSGLHISILMLAILAVLERIVNRRVASMVALIVMIGYCLLVGSGISAVRAVTMAGVRVFGRMFYLDTDSLASVAFACIALLLFEPLYLFNLGFQLSFGTVFGLIILSEPIERLLAWCRVPKFGKFRSFLAYNTAAFLVTTPILAYYFFYIPTYSLLINLIIMPTATFLVVVGMLVGVVGLFSLNAATFLAGAVFYLLQFYDTVMAIFLSLPFARLNTGSPGFWVTIMALGIMLAFAHTMGGFGEELRKRARVLAVSVMLFVTAVIATNFAERGFHVTELDMGQGYAYVLRANGYTFVINGGGNNRILGTNAGERILMPYLNRVGVGQVDAAFVTDISRHRITGIIELAMSNRVAVVYVPVDMNMDSGLGMRLTVAAERNNIPIYVLETGDIIYAGGLVLTVVSATQRLQLLAEYGDIRLEFVNGEMIYIYDYVE